MVSFPRSRFSLAKHALRVFVGLSVRRQRLDLRVHVQARKEPGMSRLWRRDCRPQGQEGDQGRELYRNAHRKPAIVGLPSRVPRASS